MIVKFDIDKIGLFIYNINIKQEIKAKALEKNRAPLSFLKKRE